MIIVRHKNLPARQEKQQPEAMMHKKAICCLMAMAFFCAAYVAIPGEKASQGTLDAQKPEMLADIFARKLAYTQSHPFSRELHTPQLQQFHAKPWHLEKEETLIDASWSLRTEGALNPPGPFVLDELRTFFVDSGGIRLRKGVGSRMVRKLDPRLTLD